MGRVRSVLLVLYRAVEWVESNIYITHISQNTPSIYNNERVRIFLSQQRKAACTYTQQYYTGTVLGCSVTRTQQLRVQQRQQQCSRIGQEE